MLSDARNFLNSKDFVNSKTKLESLIAQYPDLPASSEAKLLLSEVNEELSWSDAINSGEVFSIESYLSQFPNGRYKKEAAKRLSDLKAGKEMLDYNTALSTNSSQAWKAFKARYPNRADLADIETRIIQSEVDEIYGDSATGRLPPSTNIGFNSESAVSSVNISNDTGCDLVVPYSGPSIKSITIGAGQTATINLE